MALVLPSTVEELNNLHSSQPSPALPSNYMYVTENSKDFENIAVERRYKREVSLPNGVQNWNISDFASYLNFEQNNIQPTTLGVIAESPEQLVPVPDDIEFRQRSESVSSVSSSMDEKFPVYHNMGIKAFSTVCVDSGSTCISSDHTYVSPSPTLFKELDPEETYQNLDTYLNQRSEMQEIRNLDTISSASSVGSPMNDSNLEYSSVLSNSCSQDSFPEKPLSLKRSSNLLNDDIFMVNSVKRVCESPSTSRYPEIRRKNNLASKNCRKTRKEKQKEMEVRVVELEKERDELNSQIKYLEEMISLANKQFNTFCRRDNNISRSNIPF